MTPHGPLCACSVHRDDDREFDDEAEAKAIARAAEWDDTDPCD